MFDQQVARNDMAAVFSEYVWNLGTFCDPCSAPPLSADELRQLGVFWINPEGERIRYEPIRAGSEREQHSFDGHVWLLTGKAGEQLAVVEVAPSIVTVVIDGKGVAESREAPRRGPGPGRASRSSSPDGKYNVTLENGRVVLRNRKTDESRELKTDLPADLVLREPVQWAPDSSAFFGWLTSRRRSS